MISVLIANKCKKLLVIVPSDTLRTQLSEKFITLGILKKLGIVNEKALYPKVGIFDKGIKEITELKSFFNVYFFRHSTGQKIKIIFCSIFFIP